MESCVHRSSYFPHSLGPSRKKVDLNRIKRYLFLLHCIFNRWSFWSITPTPPTLFPTYHSPMLTTYLSKMFWRTKMRCLQKMPIVFPKRYQAPLRLQKTWTPQTMSLQMSRSMFQIQKTYRLKKRISFFCLQNVIINRYIRKIQSSILCFNLSIDYFWLIKYIIHWLLLKSVLSKFSFLLTCFHSSYRKTNCSWTNWYKLDSKL